MSNLQPIMATKENAKSKKTAAKKSGLKDLKVAKANKVQGGKASYGPETLRTRSAS